MRILLFFYNIFELLINLKKRLNFILITSLNYLTNLWRSLFFNNLFIRYKIISITLFIIWFIKIIFKQWFYLLFLSKMIIRFNCLIVYTLWTDIRIRCNYFMIAKRSRWFTLMNWGKIWNFIKWSALLLDTSCMNNLTLISAMSKWWWYRWFIMMRALFFYTLLTHHFNSFINMLNKCRV